MDACASPVFGGTVIRYTDIKLIKLHAGLGWVRAVQEVALYSTLNILVSGLTYTSCRVAFLLFHEQ